MTRSSVLTDAITMDPRLRVAPESLDVVHEVKTHDGWVLAAEFDGYGPTDASILNRRTHHYQGIYALQPVGDTWVVQASSVGGAGAAAKRSRVWSRWGGFGEVRGGWVADPNGVRIRLTDWEGRVLTANVHGQVAMLSWASDEFGGVASTELLNESGDAIAQDTASRL
jgi:hypothetical protein